MSDIVRWVLNHIFGFLANKIRQEVAESLKDGDVTNEECRRLIVRELDDIKSKLDGLVRKDLRSSLCFLTEGISGLYQSLLQFPSNENTKESTERATLVEASALRDTGRDSSGPFDEAVALTNAFTALKLHSNEHFKSAIESFKLAREKATEAFCNEALSIEDRIHASQIRMMARILEKLEYPDASVNDCLQYLQQLHDVGAIREIFSVLIDGGFKSWFNQTMRHNNASSVQDINAALFNFARKFTKFPVGCLDWPTIFASEEIYNPVYGEKRDALVGKLEISGEQLTLRCSDFTFDDEIVIRNAVVNSKGEIVARILKTNTMKIFKRSGESRTLCEVPQGEHASKWSVAAMDIDNKNNIYVITTFQKSNDHSWRYSLFTFDENGNKKLETPLSFHQSSDFPIVRMAINKDVRIAIFNVLQKILYIGKGCVESNSYEVEKSFHLKEVDTAFAWTNNLQILDVNGTKIIVNGWRTVYIYTENGQLQREVRMVNGFGFISSLAIDHTTNGFVAKTLNSEKLRLLSFSETGQPEQSLNLRSDELVEAAKLTSHPNGTLVLVSKTEAMLLKGQQE